MKMSNQEETWQAQFKTLNKTKMLKKRSKSGEKPESSKLQNQEELMPPETAKDRDDLETCLDTQPEGPADMVLEEASSVVTPNTSLGYTENIPQSQEGANGEEMVSGEASSVISPNTSLAPTGEIMQNPDLFRKSADKPFGKHHVKNRQKKARKKLLKGIESLTVKSPDDTALSPKSQKRERVTTGTTPRTPNSHRPEKRVRYGVQAGMGGAGTNNVGTSGNPKVSYAKMVTSGGQHLLVSKREAEDHQLVNSDLRSVQLAINRILIRTDPGFLVCIERTYLYNGKVHVVCKDEKTLEWAKQVILAIEPSEENHPGYEARGPKDLPPAKTFGVWIPDDEETGIADLLTLVDRCNSGIQRKHMEIRGLSKGKGGTLHIIGVREPSLAELKKLNYQPYAGCKRIQFKDKKGSKKPRQHDTAQIDAGAESTKVNPDCHTASSEEPDTSL